MASGPNSRCQADLLPAAKASAKCFSELDRRRLTPSLGTTAPRGPSRRTEEVICARRPWGCWLVAHSSLLRVESVVVKPLRLSAHRTDRSTDRSSECASRRAAIELTCHGDASGRRSPGAPHRHGECRCANVSVPAAMQLSLVCVRARARACVRVRVCVRVCVSASATVRVAVRADRGTHLTPYAPAGCLQALGRVARSRVSPTFELAFTLTST